VRVTLEEAYMIKKQQSLNIHFIPCAKITQRFDQLNNKSGAEDVNQTEFCTILVLLKLLKADFPKTDERW